MLAMVGVMAAILRVMVVVAQAGILETAAQDRQVHTKLVAPPGLAVAVAVAVLVAVMEVLAVAVAVQAYLGKVLTALPE
jgi:hypothetical protein